MVFQFALDQIILESEPELLGPVPQLRWSKSLIFSYITSHDIQHKFTSKFAKLHYNFSDVKLKVSKQKRQPLILIYS